MTRERAKAIWNAVIEQCSANKTPPQEAIAIALMTACEIAVVEAETKEQQACEERLEAIRVEFLTCHNQTGDQRVFDAMQGVIRCRDAIRARKAP